MARPFRFTLDRRIINRIIIWLLRRDWAPSIYSLLTVAGRKSGKPHSVPVTLIEQDGRRWLVAPYGEVDWVKNARAAGTVEISRGERAERLAIRKVSPEEAAPILEKYLRRFPLTKSYFEADTESSIDRFVEEAGTRPVFELIQPNPVEVAPVQ
jgi:deazaflavin-dependent oxidoreductase (nitroreductase family)